GMNIVKVFLPIAKVLPDPQAAGEARIAPGYLENLEDFLGMARRHRIRVVVSFACWGGNGVKWWHEGGQYFGRKPWRTDDGVDSIDVLTRFWTTLCTRLRDNPTVFSYTPSVEWTFPAGNLTWTHPSKPWGRLETEQGLFYWRAFLRARHGGKIADLNARYGTAFGDFSEVPLVDFGYDAKTGRYADPDAKILDYQDFKEWASRRYFKPQMAAIRRADPNHLVTLSNHSRTSIGLWTGAARYFTGFSVPEQADLVDYFAVHENHTDAKQKAEDVVRGMILHARFCCAFGRKPVIFEEFTFGSQDEQKVADGQAQMVRGTVGHASGWMNWFLQFQHNEKAGNLPYRSAVLTDDFSPTAWGLRAKNLIRELQSADLSRQPAKTVIEVSREKELAPRALGTQPTVCRDWGKYVHPMDFRWPRNEWIDLRLLEER
ncbi:MAG: hypothetical protein FJ279_31385, partial [Planctomycetes bacterium]|nr:hypothetical protein [Planctomycetota bacterium]